MRLGSTVSLPQLARVVISTPSSACAHGPARGDRVWRACRRPPASSSYLGSLMSTHPRPTVPQLLRGLHEALEIPGGALGSGAVARARMTGLAWLPAAANAGQSDRVGGSAATCRRRRGWTYGSARMLDAELRDVGPAVRRRFPGDVLKGGAHAPQALDFARGRFVSDIDRWCPHAPCAPWRRGSHAAGWGERGAGPLR